jgi:hypothetical protein
MFVLATPEQSDALHQELIAIEQELFTELGLHFKVTVALLLLCLCVIHCVVDTLLTAIEQELFTELGLHPKVTDMVVMACHCVT